MVSSSEYIANESIGTYDNHVIKMKQLLAERPEDYFYELAPYDYRWHFFNWNTEKSCKNLTITTDAKTKQMFGEGMPEDFYPKNQLFCKDGGGFKTAVGDQPFYQGEKSFF